ncbi:unnamed protein product [Alternaria sp. RS040]
MVPPVSNYQSSLEPSPLNPSPSEFSSSSTSFDEATPSSVSTSVTSSPSHASEELSANVKPEPTSPTPARKLDYDYDAFSLDDKEIATQLSQQPSKAQVGEERLEDIEDMFLNDEEVSTQLTQEWDDTGQEENSRTKTTGKREQSMVSDLTHTVERPIKMLKTHGRSSVPAMSSCRLQPDDLAMNTADASGLREYYFPENPHLYY